MSSPFRSADPCVDLYFSLAHGEVAITRRVYSAIDRTSVADYELTVLPLPPDPQSLGAAALEWLSRRSVFKKRRIELESEARKQAVHPILELHRQDSDRFFERGHFICVSSAQGKLLPLRLGATLSNDFDAPLEHYPRSISALDLGVAIGNLWERVVRARSLV